MKILVTGGNGQLGNALKEILKNEEVLFTDTGEMDITKPEMVEEVFSQFKPDWLFHGAAYTNVDGCEVNKDVCTLVNDRGTEILANACKKYNIKMIYISTDYVFDGTATKPIKPDAKPNPVSVYGATKLAGEKHTLRVEGYVLRTSWVYGDGKNFVRTMLELAEKYSELSVVSDQLGRPTAAIDLAKAIYDVAKKEPEVGIYHVTGDGPVISWADFAKKIYEIAGKKTKVNFVTTKQYYEGKDMSQIATRPAYSALDLAKTKDADLYLANWEESLKTYLT